MADAVGAVRKAAKAEKAAETALADKKTAWRSAWWKTTMALAAPTERAEVSAAYDAASQELGQSRTYTAQRRALGLVLAQAKNDLGLEDKIIFSLPPRITMAWTRDLHQQIDRKAITLLLKDDEEKLSLRAFIDGYGGTPMSTGAQGMSPAPAIAKLTPQEVVNNLTPVQRQAVVKEIVSNPKTSREVFEDPRTRIAANKSLNEIATERYQRAKDERKIQADPEELASITKQEKQGAVMQSIGEVSASLRMAFRNVSSATDSFKDVGEVTAMVKDGWVEELDRIIGAATALRRDILSGQTLDQALAQILDGGK